MLRAGIAEICVKDGEATASVADQDKIKALFPNTYGKNEITFMKGQNTSAAKKQVVGVILSGGQAPADITLSAVFMMLLRLQTRATCCLVSKVARAD